MQKIWRKVPQFRRLGFILTLMSMVFGLFLPGAALAAPLRGADSAGCQSIHPVQAGQTLEAIANYYHVDTDALLQANRLADPNRIYAGQSLCIPNGMMGGMQDGMGEMSMRPAMYERPQMPEMGGMHDMAGMDDGAQMQDRMPMRGREPGQGHGPRRGERERRPDMGQMPGDFTYYTVCPGDTLAKIAWRFGVDVPYLMQLNQLSNPNRIDAGQVLLVPKGFMPNMPQPGPQEPPQPPQPPAPPQSDNDWHGSYYNNKDLQGGPTFERTDADINFNWGDSSPGNGLGNDNFSVRWTRDVYFSGGTYRFFVAVDDGVRLYVDNVLLIDSWHTQSPTQYYGDVKLKPGARTLRLEYYEETGGASIRLSWRRLQ